MLDYMLNREDLEYRDGTVELPRLPGLGIDVNRARVLEENEHPHDWKNPVWRLADGAVAEW